MRAAPKGRVDQIEESNPALWAKLTADGPLTLGWFEDLILEVGTVWNSSGSWEFTRDFVDIRLPRELKPLFLKGLAEVMSTMRGVSEKIAKDEAEKAAKASKPRG